MTSSGPTSSSMIDISDTMLQLKLAKILEISIHKDDKENEKEKNSSKKKDPKADKDQTLFIKFDSLDTEGRGVLDIYQIRKYLEESSKDKEPIYLLEKDIRQCLNEMTSLAKAYSVGRSEFDLLVKYFTDRKDELLNISKDNLSLTDSYSKYYRLPEKVTELDEECPKNVMIKREDFPKKLDKYHQFIVDMLFLKPKRVCNNEEWKGVIPDNYFQSSRFEKIKTPRNPVPLLKRRSPVIERPKLLFELFTPLFNYKDPALSMAGVRPIKELKKEEMVLYKIKMSKAQFIGEHIEEELRYVLAIYDTSSREKITEDWVLTNDKRKILVNFLEGQTKGSSIVLVVKVFRKSGDDISGARECYCKGLEDKKLKKKYSERKMGDYWQLLMYGFVSLKDKFEQKGDKLKVEFVKIEGDETLWDVYQAKIEGRKIIDNITADFEFSKFENNVPLINGKYHLSTVKEGDEARVLDNLLRIKQTEDMIFDYYNRLYIYPQELKFGKEKTKKNSYIITTKLLKGNEEVECIYKDDGVSFQSSVTTAFSETKQVKFEDEIQIELPFPLTDKYKILFIIQEVKDGVSKNKFYAQIPLYKNNTIEIQSGKMTLQMSPSLEEIESNNPENKNSLVLALNLFSTVYPSTPETHRALNKLIEGKVDGSFEGISFIDAIHFLPHILSTLLAGDISANKKLLKILMSRVCGHCDSSEKRNKTVEKYIQHFCIFTETETASKILETCKELFTFDDKDPQIDLFKHCWLMLELLRKSVMEVGADKKFWESAVQFMTVFGKTIRAHIVKKEILGMEEGNAHMSYFIRSIMEIGYKAEAMKMMEAYLDNLTSPYIYDDKIQKKMASKEAITSEMLKESQKKIAPESAEMIALNMLKTQFLAVFEGSLHLYEASNPGNIDMSDISVLDDMLWIRHYPIAYLMRQHMLLLGKTEEINRISLYLMVGLVARLDLDSKLQGEQKEYVAAMFLPFVLQFLENFETFSDWKYIPITEKKKPNESGPINQYIKTEEVPSLSSLKPTFSMRSIKEFEPRIRGTPLQNVSDMEMLGLLYIWVLKNLNQSMLREWINNEVPVRLQTLVKILTRYSLLYSNFPLSETIDVYEEIDRNIKLIINGLKKSMFYMNLKVPGLDSSLLSGFTKEEEFPIPLEKSLRPMRTDDEGHKQLHMILTTEIVRTCLDTFTMIFDSLLKQESFEQLENLKTIIATKLFDENLINDDILLFIKDLIINYRTHIFSGSEHFSEQLLASLIKMFQSPSAQVRGRGVELLYLYTKNNFIENGNIERSISLMTMTVVEEDKIEKEEANFNALISSVEAIETTHIADVKNTTNSVTLIKKNLLRPDMNSLRSRKTIVRVESLGDIEEFILIINRMIVTRLNNLKIIENMPSSPVNGYSKIIEGLITKPFYVTNELINEMESIVEEYSDMRVSKFVKKTMKSIKNNWLEMKEYEKKLLDNSKNNLLSETELNEMCENVRGKCVKGIIWTLVTLSKFLKNGINYGMDPLSLSKQSELIEKEGKQFLSEYEKSLSVLESNPLFPVTVIELGDIIEGAIQVHKKYSSSLKLMKDKMNQFHEDEEEMNINNQEIIEILETSIEEVLYGLDKTTDKSTLKELKEVTVPTMRERNKGLKGMYCIPFEFFETIIPMIVNTFTKIEKIIDKTSNNQQMLESAKEWYANERNYITNVLLIKEKYKLMKSLVNGTLHESSKISVLMYNLTQYVSHDGEPLSKEFECLVERRRDLLEIIKSQKIFDKKNIERRKTTRKSLLIQEKHYKRNSDSSIGENTGKIFGCITGENETIGNLMDKLEMQIDKKNDEDIKSTVQKWEMIHLKEKAKSELREKAKELWQKSKETKEIDWRVLRELLIEEVDDNFAYDTDDITFTHVNEVNENVIKVPSINTEKPMKSSQNKKESKGSKPLNIRTSVGSSHSSHSSSSIVEEILINGHQQSKPRKPVRKSKNSVVVSGPVTEVAMIQDFVGEDGQFVEDAFLDVNAYRLARYKKNMKKLQKEVKQILDKLNSLKDLEKSRDKDAYSERLYTFVRGYLDTPRLFLKWFMKMREERLVQQHYVEGGICELHMILFISSFLDSGDEFNLLKKIIPDYESSLKLKQKETMEICSERELFDHVDKALQSFKFTNTCDYEEVLLLAVINYLNKHMDYKKLETSQVYSKLQTVYSKKEKHEEGKRNYYHVTFYGTVFGPLNTKSFIYETQWDKESFKSEMRGIAPFEKMKEIKELKEDQPITSIKPDDIYISVKEVQPLFKNLEDDDEFVTDHFVYEYLKKDNEDDSLEKITKRRIIYKTKHQLPSVLRRQEVETQEEDFYMTPLETCTDMIDTFTEELQKSMVKPTEEKLSKSIDELLSEKSGALEIVEIFLVKEPEKYPAEQIMELWELIQNMLIYIKKAITLHYETFNNIKVYMQYQNDFSLLERTVLSVTDKINAIIGTVEIDKSDD